ncbi:magnesium/cobalt transporter CorA [Methylohalobius crimeensis]|uniref:magnesium/cobalt transporter CorA n=1 Tax=Methylohalobius crimeensis TaxID=244365 RepID=UPI0003B3388B|nr:magnesium/cobalt transporter CorA [Methylohalobius crimeensis]
MLRLFKIRSGLITKLNATGIKQALDIGGADWIDVRDPDETERALLHKLLRTALPHGEEVEEIESSARYFVDEAGIHIHLLFLAQSEGRHATTSVACILQPNRLITIRDTNLADFRLLRMRARRGRLECQSPAELLVTILDQKVENHADNLEDIHRRLEGVSYMVLEDENSELEDAISQLARLEDSNGKIRLCLMDTQRSIAFLQRHLRERPELQQTCIDITRDIETLMSHTTFLFEKINFLMESTQGFINIEQNQIIKIFSIAAVVFLPPTLIASIYGMNFQFMPELDEPWAYPTALGLMILSGIAPYWIFKRKGWL